MNFLHFGFSRVAIAVVMVSCVWIDVDLALWNKKDRVIEHDVRGYYGYLPALFIFNDVGLEERHLSEDGSLLFWPDSTVEGRAFFKYSCGTAMLQAPFFLIGHASAKGMGYTGNGFSTPYKFMLVSAALFYLVLGLFIMRRTLMDLGYSDITIAICMLLGGMGTNVFCYATQSAGMPHVYSFFLFSLFLFGTVRWHERPSIRASLIVGFTFGLLSLVRPTNSLVILVFLLYGVVNSGAGYSAWSKLKAEWRLLGMAGVIALLPWVPQFLYWQVATGEWIFYSYREEGFFWGDPKFLEGLFGFRKGWFIYTPLALVAFIGVYFMKGASKEMRSGLLIFFLVHVYVTLCWWCWWYGGSYGQRVMVETLALLFLPLCAFIDFIRSRNRVVHLGAIGIGAFLIWLNIFQTYQYENGSLHYDAMTRELYFKQFGRMEPVPGFFDYTDPLDYEKVKYGER